MCAAEYCLSGQLSIPLGTDFFLELRLGRGEWLFLQVFPFCAACAPQATSAERPRCTKARKPRDEPAEASATKHSWDFPQVQEHDWEAARPAQTRLEALRTGHWCTHARERRARARHTHTHTSVRRTAPHAKPLPHTINLKFNCIHKQQVACSTLSITIDASMAVSASSSRLGRGSERLRLERHHEVLRGAKEPERQGEPILAAAPPRRREVDVGVLWSLEGFESARGGRLPVCWVLWARSPPKPESAVPLEHRLPITRRDAPSPAGQRSPKYVV